MCNTSAWPGCSSELSRSGFILLSPAYSALSLADKQQTDLPWVFVPSYFTLLFFFSPAVSSSGGPHSHLYVSLWLFPPFDRITEFFASVSLYLPRVFCSASYTACQCDSEQLIPAQPFLTICSAADLCHTLTLNLSLFQIQSFLIWKSFQTFDHPFWNLFQFTISFFSDEGTEQHTLFEVWMNHGCREWWGDFCFAFNSFPNHP